MKQETAAAIAEPDADGASAGSDRQQQPDGGATPWQPPEAELRDPLERALAAERLRNARRINLIRFVGVTFFFSLFVVMGLLLDRRSWQGNLHLFAPYWVVTAALYLAGRRHDGAARLMSLAIALVDMPMVFLLQWATFPTTPVPSAVAGYTLGIYVLLLAIAALSLDQPRIFFTAAVGACCEGLLQLLAQVEVGAVVSTFIVMGIAAVVTAHGSRRMTELIRMVAEDVSKRRHAERSCACATSS